MGKKAAFVPSIEQLETELKRVRHKHEYRRTLRGTVYVLIIVAAIAVLIATMFMPVLQVVGTSMEPTLENGELVLSLKNGKFRRGEVIAFYYNNKILLKRVIGLPGDQIVVKDDGTVLVNGVAADEPYVTEKGLGECDLDFPYQVPDNRIFVLGDHRSTSIDSRSSSVGCVSEDVIVGKVILKLWPLANIGPVQ